MCIRRYGSSTGFAAWLPTLRERGCRRLDGQQTSVCCVVSDKLRFVVRFMSIFEKRFTVGWRDVDPNGHVANMVYLEYAVDARIAMFAANGFPPAAFLQYGFGPVIKNDFVEYF